MALVRCPIHKIPYNDENPRGCPACYREKEGSGETDVIRELARASQLLRRPAAAPVEPPEAPPAERRSSAAEIPMITPPPRVPTVTPTLLDQLLDFAKQRRNQTVGALLIVILLMVRILTSGPRFSEQLHPAAITGDALPLPVEPGVPLTVVFAVLGPQNPRPHPTSRSVERYYYGSDLMVDAVNGVVYAVHIMVPNRSWRGLRVGMPERNAEGALSLLGAPIPVGEPTTPAANTIKGFMVYSSLEDRPRRSLKAEVRPPNGCFDVTIDLQPMAIGVITDDDRRYPVVSRRGGPLEWVITRITVLSRAVPGPDLGQPIC